MASHLRNCFSGCHATLSRKEGALRDIMARVSSLIRRHRFQQHRVILPVRCNWRGNDSFQREFQGPVVQNAITLILGLCTF